MRSRSNLHKLPLLPGPRNDRVVLLPRILIDVVLSTLFAHLITDELQSREVETHFVLLRRQNPPQRGPDAVQHRPHHLARDDLAMMRLEHEEEHTAHKRHVPLAVRPDVKEGEERGNLGKRQDEESVLQRGRGDPLHGV